MCFVFQHGAANRIVNGNTDTQGSLDNDKAARAILQYRNTPIQGIGLSPAQLLLHRRLRDSIPSQPFLYKPHPEWIAAAQRRELILQKRNAKLVERYNRHTHNLCLLCLVCYVIVVTDHQPLTGIFGDRDLGKINNPRLFRLKEKCLRYHFSIQHCPGKWHRGADAISRNPVATVESLISICPTNPSPKDITFLTAEMLQWN